MKTLVLAVAACAGGVKLRGRERSNPLVSSFMRGQMGPMEFFRRNGAGQAAAKPPESNKSAAKPPPSGGRLGAVPLPSRTLLHGKGSTRICKGTTLDKKKKAAEAEEDTIANFNASPRSKISTSGFYFDEWPNILYALASRNRAFHDAADAARKLASSGVGSGANQKYSRVELQVCGRQGVPHDMRSWRMFAVMSVPHFGVESARAKGYLATRNDHLGTPHVLAGQVNNLVANGKPLYSKIVVPEAARFGEAAGSYYCGAAAPFGHTLFEKLECESIVLMDGGSPSAATFYDFYKSQSEDPDAETEDTRVPTMEGRLYPTAFQFSDDDRDLPLPSSNQMITIRRGRVHWKPKVKEGGPLLREGAAARKSIAKGPREKKSGDYEQTKAVEQMEVIKSLEHGEDAFSLVLTPLQGNAVTAATRAKWMGSALSGIGGGAAACNAIPSARSVGQNGTVQPFECDYLLKDTKYFLELHTRCVRSDPVVNLPSPFSLEKTLTAAAEEGVRHSQREGCYDWLGFSPAESTIAVDAEHYEFGGFSAQLLRLASEQPQIGHAFGTALSMFAAGTTDVMVCGSMTDPAVLAEGRAFALRVQPAGMADGEPVPASYFIVDNEHGIAERVTAMGVPMEGGTSVRLPSALGELVCGPTAPGLHSAAENLSCSAAWEMQGGSPELVELRDGAAASPSAAVGPTIRGRLVPVAYRVRDDQHLPFPSEYVLELEHAGNIEWLPRDATPAQTIARLAETAETVIDDHPQRKLFTDDPLQQVRRLHAREVSIEGETFWKMSGEGLGLAGVERSEGQVAWCAGFNTPESSQEQRFDCELVLEATWQASRETVRCKRRETVPVVAPNMSAASVLETLSARHSSLVLAAVHQMMGMDSWMESDDLVTTV